MNHQVIHMTISHTSISRVTKAKARPLVMLSGAFRPNTRLSRPSKEKKEIKLKKSTSRPVDNFAQLDVVRKENDSARLQQGDATLPLRGSTSRYPLDGCVARPRPPSGLAAPRRKAAAPPAGQRQTDSKSHARASLFLPRSQSHLQQRATTVEVSVFSVVARRPSR